MDYSQIAYELKQSPAVKLLRSRNAALVVSFLHQQFKAQKQAVFVAQTGLEEKLGDYLEYLQDEETESEWRSPKDYLKDWCDSDWLRKSFDESDEPILSLTPETERAIAWIEDLQQRDEFVGTESRFLQIFSLLKEIQDRSTTDVETRIEQLEADRDRIQQEIDRVRATGDVSAFNQTQLQERFRSANKMTRQLVADFKSVEQNFRGLTRRVQAEQLEKDSRRGAVLGRVLDADDALKTSDQGRSFYAFWQFLMSSAKKQELKERIQAVYQLEELKPLSRQYESLRRIEYSLLDAARHIVESNVSLAAKLRQMLDERSRRENRRVAELIVEVQRLALQAAGNEPPEPDFWTLEGDPITHLIIERPFHPLEAAETPNFSLDIIDLSEPSGTEAMAELFQQFYVDETILAERIDRVLEDRSAVEFTELLKLYPVSQGLPEVVAYLSLATRSLQHVVDSDRADLITVNSLEPTMQLQLKLPSIVFHR
ncbi:MAG: DUF3375 domain-containing protein [Leptolyngbya foveolarum]|uniref:DUF3375 domain-containing protein n=1 Tax=Leptolyngbya foveolarum TaxID=47253 RepID=A0A2W4W3L8_9CYAN|nr:MAG: DUF3375 domain-containing protein [Leptolyngbya foveolarum]